MTAGFMLKTIQIPRRKADCRNNAVYEHLIHGKESISPVLPTLYKGMLRQAYGGR